MTDTLAQNLIVLFGLNDGDEGIIREVLDSARREAARKERERIVAAVREGVPCLYSADRPDRCTASRCEGDCDVAWSSVLAAITDTGEDPTHGGGAIGASCPLCWADTGEEAAP